jgi:hypothetical protein
LTSEALAGGKAHFWERTAYYRSLGYDRVAAPSFILDEAGALREGFDLVSRVHVSEGRVHAEGPVTMDWARSFMQARRFNELKASAGHLHQFSVLRTPWT